MTTPTREKNIEKVYSCEAGGMTRLSRERLEQIRESVAIGPDGIAHGIIPELLAEIDALNEIVENQTGTILNLEAEFETAAMKCNDYQMEAYKLRERVAKLRECLTNKCMCDDRYTPKRICDACKVLSADDALEQK
jgi:hypothetical protein